MSFLAMFKFDLEKAFRMIFLCDLESDLEVTWVTLTMTLNLGGDLELPPILINFSPYNFVVI